MPQPFTPALGRDSLTGLYDGAIRVLTGERRWRTMLVEQVAPAAGESIIDVGCGTGTLAILLKRLVPDARSGPASAPCWRRCGREGNCISAAAGVHRLTSAPG